MKLYLLTQSKETGYDTFDSCVVAATNPDKARLIVPGSSGAWPADLSHVAVEEIGSAKRGTKPGVICSSFNAG